DRVGSARFAARMTNVGLSLRLPRGVAPNLSMILGGTAVRMEDLVGAYTAFNRAGVAGRVRYQRDDPLIERRMLSPGAAWIVREILQANPRPGYRPGTFEMGSRPQVAWKTGTSYGFRDAWAVGGTRQYTVAAWIGRPDGTPLPGQYGAVTALPLMFQVIDSLPRSSMAQVPEAPPASVSEAEICWPLGLEFDPLHVGLCHRKQPAWVLDGVIPPTLPERDSSRWSAAVVQARIDARSGLRLDGGCSAPQTQMVQIARWPALAYPWLSRRQRAQAELPAAAPGCDSPGRDSHDLRIDGLADNTTLVRAPNSAKPVSVRLRALGTNGGVAWLLDGKLVADTLASASFELSLPDPGEHTLTALSDGGAWAKIHVRVLR
ncbi:MAG: penicillin-binding protein 1C, partial [Dokdonella sp.]